jgi:hypothetical protein
LFKGEAKHNLRIAETAAPISDQIAPAVSTGTDTASFFGTSERRGENAKNFWACTKK